MITYKYEMYFNDTWNDVSAQVETNATIGDRLDKTFDIASFSFAHIRADKFTGIDLSLAIKPWIPVRITIGTDIFRFYTADCTREMVKKTEPRLYKHNIQLVEATRILQRKTIPDITVTQPKSIQFTSLYISDYKTLDKQIIKNTLVYPTLNLQSNSRNTSYVDGNVLKAGINGELLVSFDIQNFQYDRKAPFFDLEGLWWNYNYVSGDVTLRAEVYVNNVFFTAEEFYIPATTAHLDGKWYNIVRDIIPDTPEVYKPAMHVNIPASLSNQTVTVKLRTLDKWIWEGLAVGSVLLPDKEYEDEIEVITYFSLGGGSGEAEAFIYLDELADKCIRSLNSRDINDTENTTDYRLDPVIQAKLAGKKSPEFTFNNYKVWDALEKIANTQNAVPEIKDDFRTITFRYLDDIPDMYYDIDMFDDETLAYSSNEHVDGLELNASNLVEEDVLLNAKVEPYENGWGSVRTSDELVGELSDDNAVFKTRQLIQKIYKLYIRGVSVKIVNGSSTKIIYGNVGDPESFNSYWDISSRVVTDNEWNTYPDTTANTDSARRGLRTKGNHIYYSQGSNLIKGLGYKTLTVSDIVGSKVAPRTLLETIMAECAELLSTDYIGWDVYIQGGLAELFDSDPEAAIDSGPHNNYEGILYRVEYVPLTNARTTIYKHDSFNSDSFLTDFINEQDKLNDTDNLGKYVLTTLNRQGNLQYTVSGDTDNYGEIPKLGFRTYNDLVVSARDLNLHNKLIMYTLQLSRDFINQSDYISRNSQYRAFEIPNTDVVHRQDKYTNFIVLTKNINNVLPKGYNVLSEYGNKMLTQNFCNMIGSTLAPASYGKIGVIKNKDDETYSYFDMPINAYTIGTTVNLQWEFETNYSAGAQITDRVINSIDVKLQQHLQYTNDFGQLYSIQTIMYPNGYINNSQTDADRFPEFNQQPTTGTDILTLNMVVEKDAREKYGVNIEFPFITDNSSTIRTFPGIAKYNGLVRRKDDVEVSFALLDSDYFPSVNETTLNTKRVRQIDLLEGTYQYDSTNQIYGIKYVNVPIPADLRFNGYVVYETNTKELIYAVKEDIAPWEIDRAYTTETVWFIPKKNLKDNTKPLE